MDRDKGDGAELSRLHERVSAVGNIDRIVALEREVDAWVEQQGTDAQKQIWRMTTEAAIERRDDEVLPEALRIERAHLEAFLGAETLLGALEAEINAPGFFEGGNSQVLNAAVATLGELLAGPTS